MGCLGNSKTAEDQGVDEKERREANKKIEKQLQKERLAYKATHRLLLLGKVGGSRPLRPARLAPAERSAGRAPVQDCGEHRAGRAGAGGDRDPTPPTAASSSTATGVSAKIPT